MFRWKNKSLDNVDRTKLLRSSGSYAVLIVSLGAMTFFGVCSPNQEQMGPSGAAAKVAGERVSGWEFRRMFDYYAQAFGGGNMDQAQIAKLVLDFLVNQRAAYAAAVRGGVRASDAEVDQVILADSERFKDDNGKFSQEKFREFLKANRFTERDYMEFVRRDLTLRKFEKLVSDTIHVSSQSALLDYRLAETKIEAQFLKFNPDSVEVNISQADVDQFLAADGKKKVEEYFNSNKSEFEKPAEVKARHVLISYEGARNAAGAGATRKKEDAMRRAEEMLGQMKAKNAEFATIAGANTDEPAGKTKGGDLGWFRRETMVKEFSDAAFALNKGEISGVVESPFGFHIIKVEDKRAEVNRSVDEATNEIARKLLSQDRRPKVTAERAQAIVAALRAGNSIDADLKAWNMTWETTGEFPANARSIPKVGVSDEAKAAVLGLSPDNRISDIVSSGKFKLVFRLVKRTEPEMAAVGAEKLEGLQETQRNTEAQALVGAFRARAKDNMEKKGEIWINPEYTLQQQADQEGNDAAGG